MAQKVVTKAVKVSGGEAAAGKTGNPESNAGKLADGAALIEGMLSGKSSQEDPEVAEVGAGAAAEAAGSGSESSVQTEETVEGEGERTEDLGLRTESEEGAETEQTEGEVEQAETEAGAEEQTEELTPGQEAVNKRIGELTAKRKQAEEERDALKAELEELRAGKEAESGPLGTADPTKSPSGWVSPIERIPQVREARTKVAQAAQTRELAEGLLAGEPEAALEAVRGAGVKVATAEKAIEYLQGLAKAASKAELIGESRLAAVEFNANQLVEADRKATTAQARGIYPWLLNRKSVERQMFDEVVKLYPFVKEDPAFELVVGDMVSGAMARQVAAAKAAQAKGAAGNGKGPSPQPSPRGEGGAVKAAVRPVALGKPRVGMGAGTLGKGRDGDSIRDQAMKDPTNEVARERYFERMVAGA